MPKFCDNAACRCHMEVTDSSLNAMRYHEANGNVVEVRRRIIQHADNTNTIALCSICANVITLVNQLQTMQPEKK
jgi:hypothetical protein